MAKKRTIILRKYSKPIPGADYTSQTFYSVYLNNGYLIRFKDLIDVNAWLAYCNEFLNHQVDQLLIYNGQIYTNFITLFRYLSESETNRIYSDLEEFNRMMNLAINRHHLPNGNAFCFMHLKNASETLIRICTGLRKIARPGDTCAYTLGIQSTQISRLRITLDQFPQESDIEAMKKKFRGKFQVRPPVQ